MAKIGCRYMVVAPITSYSAGSAPTYDSSKKAQLEYLTSIDITNEYNDAEIYGDNMKCESDKSMTGYSASVNLTDITPAMGAMFLGYKANGSNDNVYYTITDALPPDVGFGFVGCSMVNGVKKYDAYVYYRAKFNKDNNNAATKEKNVSFNGDSISGTGFPVELDSSGENTFAAMNRFDSYTAAKAFIDGKIPSPQSGT